MRKRVLSFALLALCFLTARGDTNDYVCEEWTGQMGAGWPSTAKVFHWHENDTAPKTGKAWAIKFDMTDTRWRFTTRLGLNNTTDTNRSYLATLKQMAGEFENEGRKPMVAINGNYFDNVNGFINIYGALWSDGKRLVGGAPRLQYDTAREFSLDGGSVIMNKDGWPRDVAYRKKIRSGTDFYADPAIRYRDGEYFDSNCGDAAETYPRSLVGVGTNEWGRTFLVMFVSDGRHDDWSHGLTDRDAVSLVVSLGCTVVAENDGGGSAGMWVKGMKTVAEGGLAPRDEEYINQGSDGGPRAVAAGLFMMYEEPFVERIRSQQGDCSDPFEDLDTAIQMGENGETFWVMQDVPLKASATNTHSCTICCGPFSSEFTAVRIANGAELSISSSVTLKNITVAGKTDGDPLPWINVLKGGSLTVAENVSALQLRTADAEGFQISSEQPLRGPIAVDCAEVTAGVSAFFGKVASGVSDQDLATSIALLKNPNDLSQIAAVENHLGMRYLKWMPGCVRVNGERRYGTLEDAVAAAAKLDNPTIEIIAPAVLTKSCVIPTNCTITATNENAWATAVEVAPGAKLTVGAGARVLFKNIAFTNASEDVVIEVAPRGTVAVSERVDGVKIQLLKDIKDGSGNPARGAFELAGALAGDVRVAGASGTDIGGYVGFSSLPFADAQASAGRVINVEDDELAGAAYETEDAVEIRWAVAEVTDENANVRFISEDGGATNNYRSLRMLFRELQESGRIELLAASCPLVEPATIPSGTTISIFSTGEDSSVVTLPASDRWTTNAVITVCGALSVENVVFDGSKMPSGGSSLSLFRILNGGSVELGAAAGIRKMKNSSSAKGVVYVMGGGTFQMGDGSFVTECSGGGTGAAAIYLSQNGAVARLTGGRIAGCAYPKGAVFGYRSGVTIEVSGGIIVTGNKNNSKNNSGVTCNITPNSASDLKLVGALTGTVGVNFGNAVDREFGDATDGGESADHFVCDVKTTKGETLLGSASGGKLVWKAVEVIPPRNVKVSSRSGTPYGTLADAVAAASAGDTLTILAPFAIAAEEMPVRIDKPLTITASAPTNVISRAADGGLNVNTVARAIEISSPGVVFENVVLGDDDREWPRAFVHILEGGELTLRQGAVIRNVRANMMRREGRLEPIGRSAAGVLAQGTLIMEEGSEIVNCRNAFDQSAGGGVLASGPNAVFDFRGGTVTACSASRGGGVCVEKHAIARVQGGGEILSNENGNLYVSAESPVEIVDVFTGRIDYREGVVRPDTETNVFASVAYDYTGDLDALAAGAFRFTNELTRACGVAVTNADGQASYAWNTAFAHGAMTYEDGDAVVWAPLGEVPPQPGPPDVPVEEPVVRVVTSLTYDGNAQTGVVRVAASGYTLTDNVSTNAGSYVATVALESGYVWADGTYTNKFFSWSIEKATYDMSGVTFTNATYTYDGEPKDIFISGELPDGVMTNYEGNGQAEVGEHSVTVTFTGDEENFYPVSPEFLTATLTIVSAQPDPPPPPEPHWEVVTTNPTPIAFKSIDRISDTEWKLVVTDRVEYCNYRLLWTDDLSKGFTATGAWEHAVGEAAAPEWTTNVITTGGAWFWRAEGADGTNMVLKVEE